MTAQPEPPTAMTLLYTDEPYARTFKGTVTAVSPDGDAVQLDRTLFYPTGGGQPGDTGRLTLADGTILTVTDTVKSETPDRPWHRLSAPADGLAEGTAVEGSIDWDRRHRHMRMHTAMHLLCSLVEGDVTGGQVGETRSRLDFNIPGDAVDKATLTERLNALIEADHPVAPVWITDEEMAANPGLVRTMSVKPPSGGGRVRLLRIGPTEGDPVDLQPCGGTHVAATGEIGPVTVAKIENKGKQNRRISIVLDRP